MCGIAGTWRADEPREVLESRARRMAAMLAHRGPDGAGVWADERAGIALGHRRLAIVDLSPAGAQPMTSASGRYVIVYNGEVYNHGDLRREAGRDGPSYRGHSDTESMLAAIDALGVADAVRRFVGMFAFALWDREERALHLVRDRLGIKPLYYAADGHTILFASELKSITADPDFDNTIDHEAAAQFLRFGYVPAPASIYRAARKLSPGTIATFFAPTQRAPEVSRYWSAEDVARRGMEAPFTGSATEAADRLHALLREAVRTRMIADVSLGAFLSGGIDSSTVVALMQEQSPQPVRTFSIGYKSASYDESDSAARVAQHLGTAHVSLVVTPEDALAVVPRLASIYDEPFADSSQVPTLLVSQLARRHVTVALSGDGGDELFGGYNRHVWGSRVWNAIRTVPASARSLFSRAVQRIPSTAWDRALESIPGMGVRLPGQKLHKLAHVAQVASPAALYFALCAQHSVPLARTDVPPPRASWHLPSDDLPHWMMLGDLITYLPDDILVKVDRASMACSLEARVPLLDHRVVELAWSLPLSLKIHQGRGKWILREVLSRYVPAPLVDRPKMGFGIPIGEWLRGPLRDWASAYLEPDALARDGLVDVPVVRQLWTEHLRGRGSYEYALWNVLMLQAWVEATRGR